MVVAAPQGGSNGPPLGARPTSAVRGRFGAAAMVTPAVAAAALSFYLAKLKFPAWSFGTAIGCHQWTMRLWDETTRPGPGLGTPDTSRRGLPIQTQLRRLGDRQTTHPAELMRRRATLTPQL